MQDPTPEWTRYIEELEERAAQLRRARNSDDSEACPRRTLGTAIGARFGAALSWLQRRDIGG